MEIYVLVVFILGYFAITIEHTIKIDKLIPALAAMAFSWAIIALSLNSFDTWFNPATHSLVDGFGGMSLDDKTHLMEETLLHHLGKTAEILVFLIGAMTIVEIIDYFNGFSVFQNIINFKTKKAILWVFAVLAFVLSAIIDNLTATIVLISILQKVVSDKKLRIWYAALIVIAANAGGAWSPIGDVTTTMLWIGKKVTTPMLIQYLLLPSIACMVAATGIASILPVFKGNIKLNTISDQGNKYSLRMLVLGLTSIIFVPIFKIITHLPPYVGMMLALGIVSIFAEIYSNREFELSKATGPDPDGGEKESKHHESPVHNALTKIELPSILFFLGILLAVAALESLGLLFTFATILKGKMDLDVLMVLFGFASAIIDNVPLVAASLGMFTEFVADDQLWHFLAYCAGTGGSMLIIGSAAGVVAMGMEKITFGWYLKKILWIALVGYFAGIAVFILMRNFI
tara:strand:- start:3651 stop:5024 length:1374 start_codon:yes stop_codon:yes gene_type:complete